MRSKELSLVFISVVLYHRDSEWLSVMEYRFDFVCQTQIKPPLYERGTRLSKWSENLCHMPNIEVAT